MMKRWVLAGLLLGLCIVLAACGAPKEAAVVMRPCAEVADEVAAAVAFEELTALSTAQLAKYLDIDEALLADGEMRIDASRATAECISVLTAADGDAAALLEALTAYRDVTLAQYRDYRPDEVPKLEKAVLKASGAQAALIVSKDAAAAEKALDAAWKK